MIATGEGVHGILVLITFVTAGMKRISALLYLLGVNTFADRQDAQCGKLGTELLHHKHHKTASL